MQDSASNPYIPEETVQDRSKVQQFRSPLSSVVKWAMIVTGVVAILVGGGLFFVIPRTHVVDQAARTQLADALQPPDQMLKRVQVASTLGFSLNYDNRVYASYAEVGDSSAGSENSNAVVAGQYYENNDLRVARAYNYVKIKPIVGAESERAFKTIPPQLEIFATISDKALSEAASIGDNKGVPKLSLFMKIDGDKRQARSNLDDGTIVTVEASKPTRVEIGEAEFQKVRYTTTNDNYRVSNVKYDDCYYAIEFNQPFAVCVTGVRPTNISSAALVEQVFGTLKFEQPQETFDAPVTEQGNTTDVDKSAFLTPGIPTVAKLTQATLTFGDDDSESDGSGGSEQSALMTVTPRYYNADGENLKAIAKTQPSVVRIGMLYCADLALKFENGETATTLSETCAGTVSTGVFISSDGYVATTGHAIRAQKQAAINGYINFAPDKEKMLDRLQRILDYLVKAKIMLESDATYIYEGATTGDQEALAKIENITSIIPDKFIVPVKEEYSYAVQPTDKPIVINKSDTNKPSFAYSDSVLKAEYKASKYDVAKSLQETFDSPTPITDVGLLKIDGFTNFPAIPIVAEEKLKANDALNIIGFPAYSDTSLSVDKIRNTPVVTSASVYQSYEKEGVRLISTTLPILPGNDGAPVVDKNGQLVGFSVYGFTYCPDQECFANGTVRSTNDLLKLLDDQNVKLKTANNSYTEWSAAVDSYFSAYYSSASNEFMSAGGLYSFNRWAEGMSKLAASLQGSELDTSLMNQLKTAMIAVLVVSVLATTGLAAAYFWHRNKLNNMNVGHYGALVQPAAPVVPVAQAAPSLYGSPSVPTPGTAPPTQPLAPLQPTQSQGLNQTAQPQPYQQPAPTSSQLPQPGFSAPQPGQPPAPPQTPGQNPTGPTDSFYS